MLGMAGAEGPDQTPWGRIDDDGTVWVRTADGERSVGSWQAGDAAAGIAFYTRRFDDLATEVTLLERRLRSGAGDPSSTRQHATQLLGDLPTAAAIGDLGALERRLTALLGAADERTEAAAAEKAEARAAAIARKEALVAEAEQIGAESTAWKVSGDRLRDIVEEWKTIRGIDRRTDDALWKRFAAARDAFGKRRGSHFAQLDADRHSARDAKEKLIARAEELSTSSEWRDTADALKRLMSEWKAAGRAGRAEEDALWARFRAAQDAFFARRSAVFAERDAEFAGNVGKREEVIALAEALDLSDVDAAQAALRELQERYEATGQVPRDSVRRLDDRMRRAEDRVREAVDAKWAAKRAESNPFLAALRERLAEAEAKLARARAAGDASRIAKAEAEVAQRKALIPD
jgi:hypothetical protein